MILQNEAIAKKWFEAFNSHNLDDLLYLYHESATHFSPKLKIRKPETNGLIKGKSELRIWWKDAFDTLPTLYYKVTSLTSNNNRVFMEYIRHVLGEEDLQVGEVLQIKNGLIIFSRVYHG